MLTADAQIRQTAQLIHHRGQMIALSRPAASGGEYSTSDSGGQQINRVDPPESLAAVKRFFGLLAKRDVHSPQDMSTPLPQGDSHNILAVLVGLPGDDIRELDQFTVDGTVYEVRYLQKSTSVYETRAECVGYAS